MNGRKERRKATATITRAKEMGKKVRWQQKNVPNVKTNKNKKKANEE